MFGEDFEVDPKCYFKEVCVFVCFFQKLHVTLSTGLVSCNDVRKEAGNVSECVSFPTLQ